MPPGRREEGGGRRRSLASLRRADSNQNKKIKGAVAGAAAIPPAQTAGVARPGTAGAALTPRGAGGGEWAPGVVGKAGGGEPRGGRGPEEGRTRPLRPQRGAKPSGQGWARPRPAAAQKAGGGAGHAAAGACRGPSHRGHVVLPPLPGLPGLGHPPRHAEAGGDPAEPQLPRGRHPALGLPGATPRGRRPPRPEPVSPARAPRPGSGPGPGPGPGQRCAAPGLSRARLRPHTRRALGRTP